MQSRWLISTRGWMLDSAVASADQVTFQLSLLVLLQCLQRHCAVKLLLLHTGPKHASDADTERANHVHSHNAHGHTMARILAATADLTILKSTMNQRGSSGVLLGSKAFLFDSSHEVGSGYGSFTTCTAAHTAPRKRCCRHPMSHSPIIMQACVQTISDDALAPRRFQQRLGPWCRSCRIAPVATKPALAGPFGRIATGTTKRLRAMRTWLPLRISRITFLAVWLRTPGGRNECRVQHFLHQHHPPGFRTALNRCTPGSSCRTIPLGCLAFLCLQHLDAVVRWLVPSRFQKVFLVSFGLLYCSKLKIAFACREKPWLECFYSSLT